jgi:hypothetical protein
VFLEASVGALLFPDCEQGRCSLRGWLWGQSAGTVSQQITDSVFYPVNPAGPILQDCRRFQRGGDEVDDGAHPGEHSSARRKDEMQYPLDSGPIRQHLDKSARGERFLAVHRRRQRDAGALARSGDQNIEAPCRKNNAKFPT